MPFTNYVHPKHTQNILPHLLQEPVKGNSLRHSQGRAGSHVKPEAAASLRTIYSVAVLKSQPGARTGIFSRIVLYKSYLSIQTQ